MNHEHITIFTPAYDKRPKNPGDPNYGIGSVRITFVVKGPQGAVQFVLYTDWYLPAQQHDPVLGPKLMGTGLGLNRLRPMGVDVGYHAYKPHYEDQSTMGPCEFLDGANCYYDGSGLRADDWVDKVLLPKGSDGVWEALEDEYDAILGRDPVPLKDALERVQKASLEPHERTAAVHKLQRVWDHAREE